MAALSGADSVIFRGVAMPIGDITIENWCFANKKPAESFLGVEFEIPQ